jgi:RNA polymerase primary sigma factor
MGKGMLVLKTAKEYQNRGLTLDELVEAGFEGLKKAAKKFHEKDKPDYEFENYAVWWIRQSIIQAIEEKKSK